jgi:hypothetical protein
VLAKERLAQRRLRRLVAKVDRRRDVAASGFVGEQHCARAQIGVVERFGERVHRREADVQSRKIIHPFRQAALKKRPAQEIDNGLPMWAGAAQAERPQIGTAERLQQAARAGGRRACRRCDRRPSRRLSADA